VFRARHLTTFLVVGLLAGCGGGSTKPEHGVAERSVGAGTNQVWLFEPKGQEPKALVVFLHGRGDAREDTPYYHRPWLRHLAERGNAVLYPRYEKIRATRARCASSSTPSRRPPRSYRRACPSS
jgi:poly(3-hydroxybutyrate) depolymerase